MVYDVIQMNDHALNNTQDEVYQLKLSFFTI
jgi:hypothetical protein